MSKVNKLLVYIKEQGVAKTLELVFGKIHSPKLPNSKRYLTLFNGLAGVEIGGPSVFFQKKLPIYKVVKSLDCVNFGSRTLWQGNLEQGTNYHYYRNKTGYQYICDTVSMDIIPPKKYDFCLSCNVLEHIANPFKAFSEWLRISKDDGLLLIIVPKKEANFDHNRPTTSFEHLKNDYDNNIGEDDLSHLEEILRLHDLLLDPPAGTYTEFKVRSLNNFQNRALHQHVFDVNLLKKIFGYFNLEVLENAIIKTDCIILGKKRMPSDFSLSRLD
jgi:SAM-dependent methyltransferase